MKNGFFDIESNCLGAYLGGYAGQYGIRFDACGWFEDTTKVDENGNEIKDSNGKTLSNYFNDFPKACGAIPILEHVALTGETVIDGPETIPLVIPIATGAGSLISRTSTSICSARFLMELSVFLPAVR